MFLWGPGGSWAVSTHSDHWDIPDKTVARETKDQAMEDCPLSRGSSRGLALPFPGSADEEVSLQLNGRQPAGTPFSLVPAAVGGLPATPSPY